MYSNKPFIEKDIEAYLNLHGNKSLLKVITCGSVDDGKSSLIGRLLYDSKLVFDDHLVQLEKDSKGKQGQNLDFSLLVDGLSSEREQGITIDVAYRYITTEKRKFIFVDTPGHEQYTRNMVTGASNADSAIILIDARKGILTQTHRHTFICHLLGIKNIVLAVNKIDMVDYKKAVFDKIVTSFTNTSNEIGILNFTAIPLSALKGDNIIKKSENTPWYSGPTLLDHLEKIEKNLSISENFRMPVQWVNRPNMDFRGFSGRIVSGKIRTGDKITIQPSGKSTFVNRIVTYDGDLESAVSGQSITLTFKDEVDCSRGQIIASDEAPLEVADQFKITLIWMSESVLLPGRSYYIKIGTQLITGKVTELKYQVNVNNMEHIFTKTLSLNSIGVANLTTDRPIPFAAYSENRNLGGLILIDKMTNETVGAGLINFALRRSNNITWQNILVDRNERANIKSQKPVVLWMTGLSGSGKSTIANALEKKLVEMKLHTFLLDGDNIRHGLNKDLGFTAEDRIENIRRVGNVAKLMSDAGLIVIVALISPFIPEREMVRKMMEADEFVEVFIDTPQNIAESRDPKGLYAKARSGSLKNFTGIDSPYEKPKNPEIHIHTSKFTVEEAVNNIIKYLLER